MVQAAADINAREIYCRDKAAAEGSNFYYASLFEDAQQKQLLFAAFALHYEIVDCLTASPDPGVNRMKLHWWSEELEKLFQQQARHPVTSSLQPLVAEQQLTLPTILNYMTICESLISGQTITGFDDWLDILSTGLGQIWSVAAKITGTVDEADLKLLSRNGGVIFVLDLLQNYRLMAARGHDFLPEELLSKHNLKKDEIISSRELVAVKAVFEALITRLENELNSCFGALTATGRQTPLYHLIMNRLARTLCIEIRKDGYQLLQHRIALTPVRKLWIAYRTKWTV